jgi:fructose-bisphosphate aldolase, class II
VILQGSAGARSYAGEPFLRHLILAAIEQYPHIPVCMHQDHGASPSICFRSIQSGFSSVMMDGSLGTDGKTPSTYEYNVDTTRMSLNWRMPAAFPLKANWAAWAPWKPARPAKEDGHGAEGVLDHSALLTDPDEAADFVAKTHVDALAIAIGTSHGAYKFTQKPTGAVLRIDRVKEIHARIPSVHLVMHGSSSVPEDWLAIINSYGGDMGQTYGVPVSEIVEGIKNGVRKVNIDTDLRMASTGAIRKHLAENKSNFDPRKFLKEATKAMSGICSGALRSLRRRRHGEQNRQGLQPGRPCRSATTRANSIPSSTELLACHLWSEAGSGILATGFSFYGI